MKSAELLSGYQIVSQSQSGIQGTLFKMANKNLDYFLMKSCDFKLEETVPLYEILNQITKKSESHLLKMVDFLVVLKSNRHNTNTLFQFFEFKQDSLDGPVCPGDHHMDQNELTKLMIQIIEAGCSLNEFGLYVGHIGRDMIYKFEESYKLFPLNLPELISVSNFVKLVKHNKESFVSFELREKINTGKEISHREIRKSDVFILGITLLEIGLGMDVRNELQKQIDPFVATRRLLDRFRLKFKDSRLLVSAVEVMLLENPKKRPEFKLLKKSMPSYRKLNEYFEHSNSKLKSELSKRTPSFKSDESRKVKSQKQDSKTVWLRKDGKQVLGVPEMDVSHISRKEDLREEDQQVADMWTLSRRIMTESRLKYSETQGDFSFSIRSKREAVSGNSDGEAEEESGYELVVKGKTRSQNNSVIGSRAVFRKKETVENKSKQNENKECSNLEMFFELETEGENKKSVHKRSSSGVGVDRNTGLAWVDFGIGELNLCGGLKKEKYETVN